MRPKREDHVIARLHGGDAGGAFQDLARRLVAGTIASATASRRS